MKKCRACLNLLPLTNFYVHPKMKDGHLNKCIECTKKRIRKHRIVNLETIHAYDRKRGRTEKRRKAQRVRNRIYARDGRGTISAREWRKRNPEKYAAHIKLCNALRAKILKKQPCKVCGKKKVEGHHEDYRKPLDVIWLCRLHHAELHRIYKDE